MIGYSLSECRREISLLQEGEELFPLSIHEKLVSDSRIHNDSDLMDMMYTPEWKQLVRELPVTHLLNNFSFEEISRVHYEDSYFFTDAVRRELENTPSFRIIQKIKSSFWRWGNNNDHRTWNMAVSVYSQILSFALPLADFEISIDWTIGYNPRGYSEKHRVYLDGVFAYFVCYRGVHVVTIGFSFTDKGELLLQQIQLVKHKGNRFLYALPSHYVDWFVNLFREHFCGRKLFIADGKSLAGLIESSYFSQVTRHRDEFKRYRSFLPRRASDEEKKYIYSDLEYHHQHHKEYLKKLISFRLKDLERITTLYGRVPCQKDGSIVRNGLLLKQVLKKPV